MKLPKYAFDTRQAMIPVWKMRHKRVPSQKQRRNDVIRMKVEEYMYKYIMNDIAKYIEYYSEIGDGHIQYYLDLPKTFLDDNCVIQQTLMHLPEFRRTFNNGGLVHRVYETLRHRGYSATVKICDTTHRFSCHISWYLVKRTNRTLRAICRCIIVFIRYREDYYKPGSKGVNTLKRNFESLIKQS